MANALLENYKAMALAPGKFVWDTLMSEPLF